MSTFCLIVSLRATALADAGKLTLLLPMKSVISRPRDNSVAIGHHPADQAGWIDRK
jgi:hypothetical protein